MSENNKKSRRKVFTFTENGAFPSIIYTKKEELSLWEIGVVVDENSPLVDYWSKKYVSMEQWRLVPDLLSSNQIIEMKKRKISENIVPQFYKRLIYFSILISVSNSVILNFETIMRGASWVMKLIVK